MSNQSYYRRYDAQGCNEAVHDRQLVVNCSGMVNMTEPFTTVNAAGRQDIYLMYLTRGELCIQLGEESLRMLPGQMILYPPGYPYQYSKRAGGTLCYYWAHFTGASAAELLAQCHLGTVQLYDVGLDEAVEKTFRQLFAEFIRRDVCFEPAAAALLMRLCVLLRRAIEGTHAPDATQRVHRALMHMHRCYSQRITMAQLAELEHLSVSRFSSVFTRCTGLSPQAYLIDLRMKAAVRLLRDTDLGIRQIAQSVGYDDALYFSRLFKQKLGCSPARYAADVRAQGG